MELFSLALALGAPTLVGLVGAQILVVLRRRLVRAWQDAAAAAGVKDIDPGFSILSRQLLSGVKGSRRVRVDEFPRQAGEAEGRALVVTVEGASGITMRAERNVTPLERVGGPREVELGDERFDRAVYVHGEEELLRAVLDVDTRRHVRKMIEAGLMLLGGTYIPAEVSVRDGDVIVNCSDEAMVRAHLADVLATMSDLAGRLEKPTSLVKRIVDNTRAEPEWQVRRGNLLLLTNEYPRHPATREALERGCQDERQDVQLECALVLGVEHAEGTLLEIATSEWAEDKNAARAVSALGARLPRDKALAILAHALRTRRQETALASLEVVGMIGGAEVVAPLAKVLAVEKGALAAAAARALGASKEPGAEEPLLRALRLRALSDVGQDVAIAAASALGQAGTAAAVLQLKEAAEDAREGALRKAAREAIAEIQSRLGGASPGQLSLADGEAGQLSLADEDPRGQVSMTGPKDPPSAPRAG